MQSILNVRMDSVLKERGDKVLSDNGVSVSDAVRALWSQLAATRTLPDFMREDPEEERAKQAKRKALQRLATLGALPCGEGAEGAPDCDALLGGMYDDMWAEYEALG